MKKVKYYSNLLTCFILPAKYARHTTHKEMQHSHQVHLQNTVSPNMMKRQIASIASLGPIGKFVYIIFYPLYPPGLAIPPIPPAMPLTKL